MTNELPESRPARISRPIPKADDFAPFDHSQTDRSRNGKRSPRSVIHKGLR